MSRPDRHTKRRTLSFEDLETKTSLTNVVGFAGCVGTPDPPAVIREAGCDDAFAETRAGLFLRYVANIENVDLERSLPSSQEADAADGWLVTNQPGR